MELENLLPVIRFLGSAIVLLALFYIVFRPTKRQSQDPMQFSAPLPDVLPWDGVKIPVGGVASGAMLRGKVSIGRGSTNTIFPALVLYEDHFEFRIIFWRRRELSRIKQVDVYGDDRHIKLGFTRGSPFYAFVPEREVLTELVAFFHRKGLTLGEEARRLIGQ